VECNTVYGDYCKLLKVNWMGDRRGLSCPATAIPVGFSREGLPVGIQAVARSGSDHLTIAVAKHLEEQGFKWIQPKLSGL